MPLLGAVGAALVVGCNAILGFEQGTARGLPGGAGGQGTTTTTTGGAGGSSGGAGGGGSGLGPIEQPCSEPADCPTGYLCVDGTCCTGPCDGLCEACNVPGHIGACSHVPSATDPALECSGGVCDGSGACAIGAERWTQSFGDGADDQRALAVAADGAGDVYVTGHVTGIVSFGGPSFDAGERRHAFVAKLSAEQGEHLWSHLYGDGTSFPFGYVGRGVAADAHQHVALTGDVFGGVDFDCGTLLPLTSTNVFIALLDGNDQCTWSDTWGEALTSEWGFDVALDEQSNLIVAGSHLGALAFGSPPLPNPDGENAFVVELSPSGGHRWSRSFGGADDQRALAVASRANTVVIAGRMRGDADFGGGTLTSAGGDDAFVASFDANGNHRWSQRFGDADDQVAEDVALDGAGNTILVGGFFGTIDLGGGPLTSAGADDVFIAKFDEQGNHLWSASYGDPTSQAAHGVAVDSSGNVVVVGHGAGVFHLGGVLLPSLGGQDVFIAKYDPTGVHLWSKRFGATGSQVARTVAVAVDDSIALAGEYETRINLGGASVESAGGEDIFVAVLEP